VGAVPALLEFVAASLVANAEVEVELAFTVTTNDVIALVLERELTVLFTNPVATTPVGSVKAASISRERIDSILGATSIKYDLASTGRKVYQAGAPLTMKLLSREEIADGLLIVDIMEAGIPVSSETMMGGGSSSIEWDEIWARREKSERLWLPFLLGFEKIGQAGVGLRSYLVVIWSSNR